MNPDKLKQLEELPEGLRNLLIEFLEEEIKKINDLGNIQGTAEERGQTVMARQEAERILKKIFGVITPKPKIVNRNQYK